MPSLHKVFKAMCPSVRPKLLTGIYTLTLWPDLILIRIGQVINSYLMKPNNGTFLFTYQKRLTVN